MKIIFALGKLSLEYIP